MYIGQVSQIYALRQALAKAIVAFYQKYVDEASKKEIKETLVQYDRTLLVADPRRCEPKKVTMNCLHIGETWYLMLSLLSSSVVQALVPATKSHTVKKCVCVYARFVGLFFFLFTAEINCIFFLHREKYIVYSCY